MSTGLVPLERSAASPPSVRLAHVATPVLFSPTAHAERRFWEFFTAHTSTPPESGTTTVAPSSAPVRPGETTRYSISR